MALRDRIFIPIRIQKCNFQKTSEEKKQSKIQNYLIWELRFRMQVSIMPYSVIFINTDNI